MAMMYFKLNIQRRYIFSGRANMQRPRNMKKENFTAPTLFRNPFNRFLVNKIGTATKYKITVRKPTDSRNKIFEGSPVPSHFTQKYSERFTLVNGTSLWGSQYSKGPKKFQLGPLKNVPIKIRKIQRIKNPYRNKKIPSLRSLNE